jgi:hypothetical protein
MKETTKLNGRHHRPTKKKNSDTGDLSHVRTREIEREMVCDLYDVARALHEGGRAKETWMEEEGGSERMMIGPKERMDVDVMIAHVRGYLAWSQRRAICVFLRTHHHEEEAEELERRNITDRVRGVCAQLHVERTSEYETQIEENGCGEWRVSTSDPCFSVVWAVERHESPEHSD